MSMVLPPVLPVADDNVKDFVLLTNRPNDVALASTPLLLVAALVVTVKVPGERLLQVKITTLEAYEDGVQLP